MDDSWLILDTESYSIEFEPIEVIQTVCAVLECRAHNNQGIYGFLVALRLCGLEELSA